MTGQPPDEIVCDAGGIAPDAAAVSALARLQLGARRQGSEILLGGASAELLQLLAFCGLGELLRAQAQAPPGPAEPHAP